ncbi:MAG: hypothetical protein KDD68_20235 [Bdellovibrionales bacterium]|nr:hypothetical protein [Bdellovibrionales bacterium]
MWSILLFALVTAHATPSEPLKVVKSYKELLKCPKESELVDQKMCCRIQLISGESSEQAPKKCLKHGPAVQGSISSDRYSVVWFENGTEVGPRYEFATNRLYGAWDGVHYLPETQGRSLLMYDTGEVFSQGSSDKDSKTWVLFSPIEKLKYIVKTSDGKIDISRCTLADSTCSGVNGQFLSEREFSTARPPLPTNAVGEYLRFGRLKSKEIEKEFSILMGMTKLNFDGKLLGLFYFRRLLTAWDSHLLVNYGDSIPLLVSDHKENWCRVNALRDPPTWIWTSCRTEDIRQFSKSDLSKPYFLESMVPIDLSSIADHPGGPPSQWSKKHAKLAFVSLRLAIEDVRIVPFESRYWVTGSVHDPYNKQYNSYFYDDPDMLTLFKNTNLRPILNKPIAFPLISKGQVNIKKLYSTELE